MRVVSSLAATILALTLLPYTFGQEAKAPDNKEVKKDQPGAKENPADKKDDKKTDDKGKDEKKSDDKDKKDTPEKKFTYGSSFAGRYMGATQNGEITIKVTQKVQTLKLNANKLLFDFKNRAAQLQLQIAQANTPQRRLELIRDLQQHNARPPQIYEIKDVSQDVILKQAPDMIVRVAVPEMPYDAKGNPVPLTAAKIKELIGPEGYPGFPGERSELSTNSLVQIYLSKPAAKDPKDAKDPSKKGPDISDIIGGTDTPMVAPTTPNGPQIVLILIRNDVKQ